MEKVIKTLRVNSYSGDFSTIVNGYTVSGTLNVNSEKKIDNLNGNVHYGDNYSANFSAYRSGDKLVYNFGEIHDVETLPELSSAVESVAKAAQAELEEE